VSPVGDARTQVAAGYLFAVILSAARSRSASPAIEEMLQDAGFDQITFCDEVPFWCAVGRKATGA